jgi:tetratricopeptide (TPR) repeat protein
MRKLSSIITALFVVSCLTGCSRLVGRYHYNVGEKLYFAEKYSEAIPQFDRSIEHGYNVQESYAMRGLAHFNRGEYDLTIADNNKALAINPRYAPAYNGRGLAYYRKGDLVQTAADMEKVLEYSTDRQLTEAATKLLQALKQRSQTP